MGALTHREMCPVYAKPLFTHLLTFLNKITPNGCIVCVIIYPSKNLPILYRATVLNTFTHLATSEYWIFDLWTAVLI